MMTHASKQAALARLAQLGEPTMFDTRTTPETFATTHLHSEALAKLCGCGSESPLAPAVHSVELHNKDQLRFRNGSQQG